MLVRGLHSHRTYEMTLSCLLLSSYDATPRRTERLDKPESCRIGHRRDAGSSHTALEAKLHQLSCRPTVPRCCGTLSSQHGSLHQSGCGCRQGPSRLSPVMSPASSGSIATPILLSWLYSDQGALSPLIPDNTRKGYSQLVAHDPFIGAT